MATGILEQFVKARGGLVGQRGQLGEQERFLETSNLRSIGIGALEALGRTDQVSQDAFLTQRIQEITSRGGDPRDTQEALNTPFEQRQAVLQNAVQIAQKAGALGGAGASNVQSRFVTEAGTVGLVFRDGRVEDTGVSVQESFALTDEGLAFGRGSGQFTQPGLQPDALTSQQIIKEQRAARSRKAVSAAEETRLKTQASAAIKAGEEAAKSIKKVDVSINNINRAISALDKGARTGAIQRFLPSVAAASVELDNIRNTMGLDIIGATTFGALSESELEFALSTALPDRLNEEQLKDFLIRKRDAQKKARKALANAARQFSQGKTMAELIPQTLPPGVSEEDIEVTMKFNDMTRQQVLERLIRGR